MNNKTRNIVIWVIALAALLTAAYVFYHKSKTLSINPPSSVNSTSGKSTASGTQSEKSGNTGIATGSTATGSTASQNQGATAASGSTNTSVKAASGNTAATSSTGEGKIMAPDFTLKDPDGKEVTLSDYRGKIVFLNFWAVWCKYCKQEMPDLNRLNAELEKDNDAVILAVDVQETEDVVKKYLTSENIGIKVLMDKEGTIAGSYGVEGYPTTFVINKDGAVYTYIPGATNIDTLHDILKKIRNGEPVQ